MRAGIRSTFSDPFGLSPCDDIVDWDNIDDATTDQFEDYWVCKNKEWAEQAAGDAEEAVGRARRAGMMECAVARVDQGRAFLSDTMFLYAVAAAFKLGYQAVTGPIWRAGLGLNAAGDDLAGALANRGGGAGLVSGAGWAAEGRGESLGETLLLGVVTPSTIGAYYQAQSSCR